MAKTKDETSSERKLLTHPDQLPDFSQMTWEEEDEFWQTHDFTDDVLVEDEEAASAFYKGIGVENSRAEVNRTKDEVLSSFIGTFLQLMSENAVLKAELNVLWFALKDRGVEAQEFKEAERSTSVTSALLSTHLNTMYRILSEQSTSFDQAFINQVYIESFERIGPYVESQLLSRKVQENLEHEIKKLKQLSGDQTLAVDQLGDIHVEVIDLLTEVAAKLGAQERSKT